MIPITKSKDNIEYSLGLRLMMKGQNFKVVR